MFEVEEDTVAAVRAVMVEAPHSAVGLDLPLVVDAGQGPNWAVAR